MTKIHGKAGYQRLPAQQSIRVFEAAARHLNFTKAADELALTQSGVSKQIKGLEAFLGVSLFQRGPRRLALTPAGQRFFQRCTQALDILQLAVEEAHTGQAPLKLQVPPTFAARWLIPKMGRLKAEHPELDVHIETTWMRKVKDKVQAEAGELITHVCQGYGFGNVQQGVLRRECLSVLASPDYLARHKPIRCVADLAGHTLIHTRLDGHIHWQAWADNIGAVQHNEKNAQGEKTAHSPLDVSQGYEFETLDMALSAAENGIGLVVCDLLYAIDALANGRLIIPFNMPMLLGLDYLLLSAKNGIQSQSMGRYRAWLAKEIEQDEARLAKVLTDLGFNCDDKIEGFGASMDKC